MPKPLHILCLGDSYTIGEAVPPALNFPHQLQSLLKDKRIDSDCRIVAKTGWTTDELLEAIEASGEEHPFLPEYDWVTLLIGVNNQYRGRALEDYATDFETLLKQALDFAGGHPEKVAVLSIPDWGVTPYAEGRNRTQIAIEIDRYNQAAQAIAKRYHIYYIDITGSTRAGAGIPGRIAEDGLHPGPSEYRIWAELLFEFLRS